MRILGIDYGTKRIGLAISDEEATLAFPKEILPNDSNTFQALAEIIKNQNISEIVIGESSDFSGKPNMLSAQIEIFISVVKEKFEIPVYKQKEFLTSVEARRSKNGNKKANSSQVRSRVKKSKTDYVDASAAALILQRYLDKKNK